MKRQRIRARCNKINAAIAKICKIAIRLEKRGNERKKKKIVHAQ